MKRLSFIGFFIAAILAVGSSAYFVLAQDKQTTSAESRSDDNGKLSSATVSFGSWMAPVSRFPNLNPIASNHHALSPRTVKIKAGGTVNFIVAGFHNIVVYDDGTQPGDIDTTLTVTPTNGGPPLINDPEGRIYRGVDPSLFPQDRVEVVRFDEPGTYLVICAVRPHFVNDAMYGYVRVLPNDDDDDSNKK